jgi:hypothetical protein
MASDGSTTKRNNDLLFAYGTLDFASHPHGVVGVPGEDQQNDLATRKCIDNRLSVFDAGQYVAGRNPATDALLF